jgi:hypothetical protein
MLSLLSSGALSACESPAAPAQGSVSAPAAAGPSIAETSTTVGGASVAPFELGAVVERVHFAFREEAGRGRFAGGHSTYAIEVDAVGAVVRPFHASGAQDGEGSHTSPGEVREGAPLRLEVARIERGGAALVQRGGGRARVDEDDGHLAIARGEVVEHYRNRDDGVEQSWSFERAPSGTGPLRVRVEASGLAYVGETASGLHFADAETGLGFRYGHGTWIDAAGRETAVPAQWSNGGIELVVPSDVVASSRYPAVLDPIISPEIAMDEPVLAPFGGAENVSVASDGRDFLVVWMDARGGESTVVGTRVTAAGEVLDPTGLTIARRGTLPSVASNGSGYLVTFVRDGSVRAIRLGSEGMRLEPELTLGSGASAARTASNGSSYLVVWPSGPTLYAARVSAEGAGSYVGYWDLLTVVNPPPDVASDGRDYFVVWQTRDWFSENTRVFGARVSGAGSILDFPGRRLWTAESDQVHPSVAFNGSEYFVVWRTAREGRVDILGTRVSPSGELLTPSALLIGSGTVDSVPRVASDGAGALVTYEVGLPPELDIRAMRVTSAGAVVDPRGLVVCAAPGDQRTPVVTSNGSGYFVAWSDARNRSALPSVYGARVTSEGAVLEPDGVPLSRLPNEQTNPVVAWNGRHHLVAWVDARTGEGIYVARVSAGGEVLDAVPPMIDAGGRPIGLRVASNGEDYFLVWEAVRIGVGSPVRGARVSAAGVVLDPTGLEISSWASSPDVAAAGGEYLVVFRENGIRGRRVSASGELLGPGPIAIRRDGWLREWVRVSANGTQFLVVWDEFDSSRAVVRAARVAADGTVGRLEGEALGFGPAYRPIVASNGEDWLVAAHARTGLAAVRVSASGAVRDGTPILISRQAWPAVTVASDQTDYLVAWQQRTVVGGGFGEDFDLYGTRIRGGVRESEGTPLATGPMMSDTSIGLASSGRRTFLVAYARSVAELAPFGTSRVRARLIEYPGELGEVCEADDECASGFCTDGVCCDARCDGGELDCQACSVAAGAERDGTCGALHAVACSDERGCTVGDVCEAGVCQSGTATPCDDATMCIEAGPEHGCGVCPPGTYSADGTGSSACTPCDEGSYSREGATACTAWRACEAGQHVSVEPSATRDRECVACEEGTFSMHTNASACEAWAQCDAGSYVRVAGDATRDRECAPCDDGTYSVIANAEACTPWTACAEGEYESGAPSATRDRICRACTRCEPELEELRACSATRDAVCGPRLVRDAGVNDAGLRDAGADGSIGTPVSGGCGCGVVSTRSPLGGVLMVVLAIALRWRARRRAAQSQALLTYSSVREARTISARGKRNSEHEHESRSFIHQDRLTPMRRMRRLAERSRPHSHAGSRSR